MTIPNTDERAAELLHWAADRLTHVYAENPRLDYVLAMHREAERLAPGLKVEDINYRERAAGGTIISESMDPAPVMTALDPLVERVVCTLAADRPDKWSEVLDGRTEARTWLVGMTSFHFGGEIDRNAVQAYIDGQVDRIRELDVADAAGRKTWAHSRMPQPRRACGVPERVPVEDVVAMAVVEGTAAEFLVSMPDKAQGNHDDPDKHPRMEFMIDRSDSENLRVIDVARTQLLPDGSLSIVTTPADLNDTEEWVTLDMKGPPVAPRIPASSIKPTVTLTKSELTTLLEQAFAEGVGCDERYEGGADNQLACVTDILDDVLFEGPTRLEDMTPEQREQVAGMTCAYLRPDTLSPEEITTLVKSIDLSPGTFLELPEPTLKADLVLLLRLLATEDGDHGHDRQEIYNRIILTPIYRNDPLYRLAVKTFAYRMGLKPTDDFPKPLRKDDEEPCGECHLQVDETCDICGAKAA